MGDIGKRMAVRNSCKPAKCAKHLPRALTAALCLVAWAAQANDIDVEKVPQLLLEGVSPNLVVTLDDSRSMARADAPNLPRPGRADNPGLHAYFSSPDVNRLYYDPDKRYAPGVLADGRAMDRAVFSNAVRYPYRGASCGDSSGVDLGAEYTLVVADACALERVALEPVVDLGVPMQRAGSAYYHRYNPANRYLERVDDDNSVVYLDCPASLSAADNDCKVCGEQPGFPDAATPNECFDRFEVTSDSDQAPNFANWYSYHRTRMLTAKTAVSRVMQTLPASVRLSYQGVGSRLELQPGDTAFELLGQRFNRWSENKTDFYTWLSALAEGEASFVSAAHIRAGEFVATGCALADDLAVHRSASDGGVCAGAPEAGNRCGVRCRNNFHLVITDGYWEDGWGYNGTTAFWPEISSDQSGQWIARNHDGDNHPLPMNAGTSDNPFDGIDYSLADPATRLYADDNTGMLADIAFFYWARDLDRDPSNNQVPMLTVQLAEGIDQFHPDNFWNPNNDPADWQHLTLSTVGFGVGGAVLPSAEPPYGTYRARTPDDGDTLDLLTDGFPDDGAAPYDRPGPYSAVGRAGETGPADDIPDATKVDDLYHAALNGRGRHFDAADPADLIASFARTLEGVSTAAGADASNVQVAISSPSLNADSLVYQAIADATTWRGQLRAYRVSQGYGREPCATKPRGELCERTEAPFWLSSFSDSNDRVILTQVDGAPGAFDRSMFDDLSDAQKRGLLGCPPQPAAWVGEFGYCALDASVDEDSVNEERRAPALLRIDWLRGDSSGETGAEDGLRQRDGHVLGDILGSNIVVVGAPSGRFNDADYFAFRGADGWRERPAVVYVGANDGMLHAFDAADGKELFAYVPESVYPHLAALTVPGYGRAGGEVPKQAFVDGRINSADARFTDKQGRGGWHTVLIGALGLGAQGIYALDVTDPLGVAARSASDLVLWEFTDASGSDADDGALDGRDMGYSPAEPAIVRIDDSLDDDREPVWVALVSNGYNNTATAGETEGHCSDGDEETNCTVSQTGNAVLYVLNLGGDDAARIRAKLDTGRGSDDDPRDGAARTNALAQVTAVDVDTDLIADLAYAGDLFGNLWRFDLVDPSRPPRLLFSSTDGAGDPQPITTKLVYQRHPYGIGALILFGTGQYLNAADKSDRQVQSFYAIWDDGGVVFGDASRDSVATRDDLLQQRFEPAAPLRNGGVGATASIGRVSTNHAIDWSVHRGWYIDLIPGTGDVEGERVVVAPQVRANRVVFVSMIPGDCCSGGGASWVNALDAKDGSRLAFTPFDYDLDGRFDGDDRLSTEDGQLVVGSSIRLVTDPGGGVYSSPSVMGLGGSRFQSIISDSRGGMIRIQESAALDWRNWNQLN